MSPQSPYSMLVCQWEKWVTFSININSYLFNSEMMFLVFLVLNYSFFFSKSWWWLMVVLFSPPLPLPPSFFMLLFDQDKKENPGNHILAPCFIKVFFLFHKFQKSGASALYKVTHHHLRTAQLWNPWPGNMLQIWFRIHWRSVLHSSLGISFIELLGTS